MYGRGMSAKWIIPTLIYIVAMGGLGITSKFALGNLRWQDLIMWSGIGYVLVVIVMLIIGKVQVEFVTGSGWAVLSAALVITALFSFYGALSSGLPGKVVPVSAAYPAVTLVLAAIFLSGDVTVLRSVGVAVVVAGVTLVTMAR